MKNIILLIIIMLSVSFAQMTKKDTLIWVNKAIIDYYGEEIIPYYSLDEPANGIGYIFNWTHPTIPKPTKTQMLNYGKTLYQAYNNNEYLRNRELEYPTPDDMARALFEKEMGLPGKYNTLRDSVLSVDTRYPVP